MIKKRNYLTKLLYLASITIFLNTCCHQGDIEEDECKLFNFEYIISNDNMYSTHIYNRNKMIGRFVKHSGQNCLYVKVFISDDHEEKIIGTVQLNGDTIALSYKHKKSNWFIQKIFGSSFLVNVYELDYYINGIEKNRDYYIRFNNPEYFDSIGIAIKLEEIVNPIPDAWILETPINLGDD